MLTNKDSNLDQPELFSNQIIHDEEKLSILKEHLFDANTKYPIQLARIETLIQTLDCLERLREAEFQRKYSLRKWFDDVIVLSCQILIVALIFGYFGGFICGSKQSTYCKFSNSVHYGIHNLF